MQYGQSQSVDGYIPVEDDPLPSDLRAASPPPPPNQTAPTLLRQYLEECQARITELAHCRQ
ncbi:hypothetical protein KIPB_010969, partial [Kipferlia bialata]|eukprot:g10969.t1